MTADVQKAVKSRVDRLKEVAEEAYGVALFAGGLTEEVEPLEKEQEKERQEKEGREEQGGDERAAPGAWTFEVACRGEAKE